MTPSPPRVLPRAMPTPPSPVLPAALAVILVAALPAIAAAAPTVHTDTSEVRACLPLAGGGVLVGTAGGLVRVDAAGVRRETWTAADGLPGTRIETLIADGDGIWLGADGGGARIRVDGGGLTVARSVAGRPLRDVVQHAGITYAATWEGGVMILDGRRPRAVAYKGKLPAARLRVAALASQGGRLWAGTAAGLYALRGGRLERVAIAGDRPEPAITGLLADGDRLWIATPTGLLVREADGVRDVGAGDLRRVTWLDGAVVTAGIGDGLRAVDRGRLGALAGGPGLLLAQAVGARDGAACAGGLDGLWLRASAAAPWRSVAPAAGLPSNDISALAADGDRVWVGTFDRGLAVRDRGAWRAVTHPDLDLRINALLVEPRPAARSRLWVATAAGLMTLDGSEVSRLTRRDGLPGRSVLALARLRDGRVVAGTTTGVWRGPATAAGKGAPAGGWQRYSLATGHLRDDWVMAIAARGRAVWVGSYKGGVVRFDLARAAVADSAPAGAPAPLLATHVADGWINPGGLTWDGARLVASTQEGLRSSDGTARRSTVEPGLPGKDVTAFARTGTTRWIATRRGLVELDGR